MQAYKQVVNDTSVFKLDLPSTRAKYVVWFCLVAVQVVHATVERTPLMWTPWYLVKCPVYSGTTLMCSPGNEISQ